MHYAWCCNMRCWMLLRTTCLKLAAAACLHASTAGAGLMTATKYHKCDSLKPLLVIMQKVRRRAHS